MNRGIALVEVLVASSLLVIGAVSFLTLVQSSARDANALCDAERIECHLLNLVNLAAGELGAGVEPESDPVGLDGWSVSCTCADESGSSSGLVRISLTATNGAGKTLTMKRLARRPPR